jgi:hypothetical protein
MSALFAVRRYVLALSLAALIGGIYCTYLAAVGYIRDVSTTAAIIAVAKDCSIRAETGRRTVWLEIMACDEARKFQDADGLHYIVLDRTSATVTYQGPSGVMYTDKVLTKALSSEAVAVGDKVVVRYDPAMPQRVDANASASNVSEGLMLLAVGALLLGGCWIVRARPERPTPSSAAKSAPRQAVRAATQDRLARALRRA